MDLVLIFRGRDVEPKMRSLVADTLNEAFEEADFFLQHHIRFNRCEIWDSDSKSIVLKIKRLN